MNNRSLFRVVVLCVCLATLMRGVLLGAQAENLLTNPGFERPFVEQGGEPVRLVAQGWTPWHIPARPGSPTFMNQQPEYLPAAPDAARIRAGADAQVLTSFFATFDGGVYQEVSGVRPGQELRFTTLAYTWSSAFDEVDVSEVDGDVVVQVGIDPDGGTDPTASEIVWSPAREIYDEFAVHSVTTTAQASTVTAFIRAVVSAPAKNNFVYLDEAALTVVGGAPVATNTSTATPTRTVAPSNTPAPTATRVEDTGIVLSQTPTQEVVEPLNTPVPTNTPAPTNTTAPTNTAVPTNTAAPTNTPRLTNTPAPTDTAAPTNTPVVATTVPTFTPSPTSRPTLDPNVFRSTVTITVQAGDSLDRLARLYGSTIEAIAIANNIQPTDLILPGQSLIIPVRLPPVPTSVASPTLQIVPTNTPTQAPPQSVITYTVQVGDTLSAIAQRFNTSVQAIAQLNGIVNPDRILLGQQLRIPVSQPAVATPVPPTATPVPTLIPSIPVTYVVQPGDTLFRISLQYGVPVARIISLNAITDPNRIFVGQVLRLQ